MVTEFFENEKIVTTVPKAKELRSVAEKMITLGKRDSLHTRRQALSFIRKKPVVFKLFDELAPRYADRNGGYTRILRLGTRKGDSAEMAIVELVGSEEEVKESKKKAKPKAKKAPAAEKPEAEKEGKKSSAPKNKSKKTKKEDS